MPKCTYRSSVMTEWMDLPIRVEHQVEAFDDGTERHTFKIPAFARTFQGATRDEAAAQIFNCHPLR